MCWGLKRTRAEWYQRALFAGDGWKEIRQPHYDFFLCPFSGERKKVSPSSLFHPFSDSHKVWDIWWFMGRGREEKKEMEKRRGRGGKGVQTWCKPFGGARGGCQHSLLCLNWGGSDRIYSMPATSLSPRTRAHTHYQCWGQSLAIGWGVCLLLLYCVSLHHRWGHRRRYYHCSYYYNQWGLGANMRARIKEHKEIRETAKKKTGLKTTRQSTREDERSAFSLNIRPWLNLIEPRRRPSQGHDRAMTGEDEREEEKGCAD